MKGSRGRRPFATGLIVCGLSLLVVSVILAATAGSGALIGAIVVGLPTALMLLLVIVSRSSTNRPVLVSGRRVLALQPIAFAVAATGVAIAVAGHDQSAPIVGGALTAVALAVDASILAFWWHDRRQPSTTGRPQ